MRQSTAGVEGGGSYRLSRRADTLGVYHISEGRMLLFVCLARVKCQQVQCAGLFQWSMISEVLLNGQTLNRLSQDVESQYCLDCHLQDGDNHLEFRLTTIHREHRHVCTLIHLPPYLLFTAYRAADFND